MQRRFRYATPFTGRRPVYLWTAALVAFGGLIFVTRAEAADERQAFEERTMTFTGGEYKNEQIRYRLLRPARIEPGQKYPLVLFLHGAGERGTDNKKQLQYLPESMASANRRAEYPCFLLAPQCRPDKRWVEVNWGDKQSTPMAAEPGTQLQVVIQLLQQVWKDEPVDRNRVYLTGLSMGGYGAWELACRQPDWFAALAPICGGGDEHAAPRLRALPIWAFHGDADPAVPVVRSRSMVEAVKAAGGKVKYSEYPGVGHNSWGRAYSDESGLLDWMFAQRRP